MSNRFYVITNLLSNSSKLRKERKKAMPPGEPLADRRQLTELSLLTAGI